MALRLIRRGARLHPNEVESFNRGWVNVVSKGTRSPYLLGANDLRVTVMARNCDGVRIIDWGISADLYSEEKSDGPMHSLVACVTGKGWGGVVRVLNPTENTEVTIMSEPLPPPYFVGLLRAWVCALVGGHNGAKETGATVRVWAGLVRRSLRRVGGATPAELHGRHHNHAAVGVHSDCGLYVPAGVRRREYPQHGHRHLAGGHRPNLGHLYLPSDLTTVGVAA